MAAATGNTIVTSGTGVSDWVDLPPRGSFIAFLSWAGGAGVADIVIGPPGVEPSHDLLDGAPHGNGGTKVGIVAAGYAIVPGGCSVALDVSTHTSVATLLLVPCDYPWREAQA